MGALHTRYFKWILVLLLPLGGMGDFVQAQEVGLFRLRGWDGKIRFRFLGEWRATPKATQRPNFQEALTLSNRGFIISPRLLDFQWIGNIALFQEWFTGNHIRQYSYGRFLNQNFIGSFLKNSTYPLVLVWTKSSNIITLNFAGRSTYDINNLQATLRLRNFFLPSSLKAEQRDLHEEWTRAGWTTHRNQLQRTFQYAGFRGSETSTLEVSYDFFEIHDRIRLTRSYNSHTARLRYRRMFGNSKAQVWNANFRLYRRKGISDYLNARINQLLQIQHSPNLSSRFRYTISTTRALGQTSLLHSAYASISHLLYTSLSTNLGVGGTYGSLTQGKERTFIANSSVHYTKSLPLSGRLQLGYTRSYSLNDRQIESTVQAIVHERHIFTGDLPVLLNERNILVSTIIVFDAQGTIIYEEGEDKDYVVRMIGDRVEIYRNPLGRIHSGQTVLIDYQYHTSPSMRYTTNTTNFNAGLVFQWLLLYYRVNRHDQTLLSGSSQAATFLQDLFIKTLGAELAWRGRDVGLELVGGYKIYESRALAFKSTNVRQSFFYHPMRNVTLSVNLALAFLQHSRVNREFRVYTYRSTLRWRIQHNLSFQGFGGFRIRQETDLQEEGSTELGGSLRWYWHDLILRLAYEQRHWEFGHRLINERRVTVEFERVF